MESRIAEMGRALHRIVRNLGELGFRFTRPGEALPGPQQGTEQAIARIEREIGELPLAIKLFWSRIGSVDLSGQHPEWTGAGFPDPLIVYPPSVAISELEEFIADREERLDSGLPYVVPVAPDALHKADVSGGMWYNLSVPAGADDPPLNDEPHNTTFLGYLGIAIEFGGFPGLQNSPSHRWPIAAIVAEA